MSAGLVTHGSRAVSRRLPEPKLKPLSNRRDNLLLQPRSQPPPCFGPDARTPRPLVANPPALLILLHLAERLLPAHSLGPSLQRNNPDNELLLKKKKKGTE